MLLSKSGTSVLLLYVTFSSTSDYVCTVVSLLTTIEPIWSMIIFCLPPKTKGFIGRPIMLRIL